MNRVDLLVVGGGINGVGIARDAAGRGLRVFLCEKDDFASHTSSWSTKLIHGGLRYLEHREFRLVRESLIEREVLMDAAPHLISPLRFILPYHDGLRPAWVLRFGLFLYDHIGGRKHLPPTERRDLMAGPFASVLKPSFKFGFEYTDCRTDDSRLVITNAIDARERGATLLTRTSFLSAARRSGRWAARLRRSDGTEFEVDAKAVVNAAGPWVTELFGNVEALEPQKKLRLVKGSHLITRRLYEHDRAYIFQNADGRIVFAIPYANDTTLIGTTDEAFEGDPAAAAISTAETAYLLEAVNQYLAEPVREQDIVGSFSGVRPLYDDLDTASASAVTRDYAFDVDSRDDLPFLSVYGGKLTTYRKLAQHAMDQLKPWFPEARGAWTRGAHLPGGEMGAAKWPSSRETLRKRYSFLPAAVFDRLASAYGGRLADMIGDANSLSDLGQHFGAGLFEREVDHMVEKEWAVTVDDILQRRTKLGANLTAQEREGLDAFLSTRLLPASE